LGPYFDSSLHPTGGPSQWTVGSGQRAVTTDQADQAKTRSPTPRGDPARRHIGHTAFTTMLAVWFDGSLLNSGQRCP
jgi:hypothetical protein